MAEIAGWLPAVILPVSTILQLVRIFKSSSVEGVSALSWALFGVANVGAYLMTEKYADIQPILAFLLTAVLDVVIVAMVLVKRSRLSDASEG